MPSDRKDPRKAQIETVGHLIHHISGCALAIQCCGPTLLQPQGDTHHTLVSYPLPQNASLVKSPEQPILALTTNGYPNV